jgi:hypothetical protein
VIAETSATVIARLVVSDGYYDFRLDLGPGSQPSVFVAENPTRSPVQFMFTKPGTPISAAIVVDENNDGYVNTAQEWTIYAIVKGITTASVTITDPNATVTLREDNAGGFSLTTS